MQRGPALVLARGLFLWQYGRQFGNFLDMWCLITASGFGIENGISDFLPKWVLYPPTGEENEPKII
jgi:hypothetical protein